MSPNSQNNLEDRQSTSDKKTAFVERDLYLKPLLRLKQQEDLIEKGLATMIEKMKLNSSSWLEAVHERQELATIRQKFLNTLYKEMEDITNEMESVKYIANHPEQIQDLDVNTYKLKLIKLSRKMQDLTKSCRVEPLLEEQAVLEAELREFQPNLHKYESLQGNATSMAALCPIRSENKNVTQNYKKIRDFHALVAATGHTDHWSMEDHFFFLKMRQQCDSIPALVAAIQKKCPDLSAEVIVNHESWYKQYESLRDKQKAAVKVWRRQKEQEKTNRIEQFDKELNGSEQDMNSHEAKQIQPGQNDKTGAETRIAVSRKVRSCPAEMHGINETADLNTREKKELIRKWRIEKENKRSMDEEQLRNQRKMKREMEESKRREHRKKNQEALEEYRKKKYLTDTLKESNERTKEKCTYDATLIKAFRKQDEEYTRKRKDLIDRTRKPNKSETVGIRRMELVEVPNYSTLLDSTKVWRAKCKAVSSTNHSKNVHYIKDVPRICLRWRNEESEDLKI